MPSRDYSYRISATDNASGVLQGAARKIDRALKDTQDGFDTTGSKAKQMAQVLRAASDQIEGELDGASQITDRLRGDFGLAADDAQRFAEMLSRAGFTAADLKDDGADLVHELQRLEDVSKRAGQELDRGLGNASTGVRSLGIEADQSRSVLANMAGNATQDLGELGGVAGTAGMALGQLAEYATEGNIKLANLAAVAGPMAILAVGVGVVTSRISAFNKAKAESAERTREFVDALRSENPVLEGSEQALSNLTDTLDREVESALREAGASYLPFIDAVKDGDEALKHFADFSLTTAEQNFEALRDAVENGEYATSEFAQALVGLVDSGQLTAAQAGAIGRAVKTMAPEFAAAETEAANLDFAMGQLPGTMDDTASSATNAAPPVKTLAERQQELADAAAAARDALYGTADAIEQVNQESRAVLDANVAYEEAIDSLAESIRGAAEDGSDYNDTLDATTERGRENIRNAEQVAQAMAGLIAARLRETGSIDEARRAGLLYVEQLKDQLRQMGLTEAEVAEYLDTLNLTPEDITTQINLANTEQATRFLTDYETQINELPQDHQTFIETLINQGMYLEAERQLNMLSQPRRVMINPAFGVGTAPIPTKGAFAGGASLGPIPGPTGSPVPIVAHAGEIVLNAADQANIAGTLAAARSTDSGGDMHVHYHGSVYGVAEIERGMVRAKRRIQMMSRM